MQPRSQLMTWCRSNHTHTRQWHSLVHHGCLQVKFAEDFGSFGTYSMEKANLTRFSYFAGRFDVG